MGFIIAISSVGAMAEQFGWFGLSKMPEDASIYSGYYYDVKPVPTPITTDPTQLPLSERCISVGGIYDGQFSECSGIDQTSCTEIGGTFNGCASPWRKSPGYPGQVCIQSCEQVCQFN